ncbi:MAG: OmpA family protein, partial [Prevotellaceae bacterium]|nr:OmpA family protein [Prevotellaceae bacterium]
AKAAAPEKTVEMTYAKSDFVPGDEIIFDDPMDAEQLGEFPSMWDLYSGNAEIAAVDGKKAMLISERFSKVGPLMKAPKNYLGDVFTVEFDYLFSREEEHHFIVLSFYSPDATNELMHFDKRLNPSASEHYWRWVSSNGHQDGRGEVVLAANTWHHVSISFNKRAWKLYIDGVRYINVPNVASPPGWFDISLDSDNGPLYITNMRIAKGAVPLYDRMMSEGKFITYGITFDVGKSTIKPESMGEINRIAQLMKDNPDLKFSVEGHTDNTGSAVSNQKLSDERSAAVVSKLVELGIAKDRLTSAGKGQNNPIADNSTDEGRAKNRRVEFVKQ